MAKTAETQANEAILAGMLGNLLPPTSTMATRSGQGGMDLGSLLSALTGGGGSGLGSLLGGGEAASTTSTDGLGGLGSLLGSATAPAAPAASSKPKKPRKPKPTQSSQPQQPSGGGLTDLLGSLFGGQSSSNSPLSGIANAVSQRTGLPLQIAQMLVSFVMGKLLGGTQGKGLNLGELSGMLSSGGVDQRYASSTGLAQEFSQQTGVDAETASQGVAAFLNMMRRR